MPVSDFDPYKSIATALGLTLVSPKQDSPLPLTHQFRLLQQALINKKHGAGNPRSFRARRFSEEMRHFDKLSVLFPKIGVVDSKLHRPIEEKIKTVTVSINAKGQYFASVLVDDGEDTPEKSTVGKAIGIDLGLTHFAITSDGSKFNNPRWIAKHERNLRAKQKRLSRQVKGSNNRNKTRRQVAGVHNKISRCREDFHHKLSRRMAD